ncbi:hypothetical protein SADO_02250 [Salinisphaera dokdonensis CL-ES53]|uniref:DUF4878 domain-containing protein n=1 Tax=Salinisphaera dokdonensis CL-ES53 TaxID=1304272 RepID=A0ABV2AWL4_9GAMM
MITFPLSRPGRRLLATAALLSTLILAGCSDTPNTDDLQPLLQQQLRESVANYESTMRALGGEQGVEFMRALGAPEAEQITVENVEIFDTRELDNGDYELQIRYDVVAGDSREIETSTVRMDKADSGWRLLPN